MLDKDSFYIKEVSDIVGVKPQVIRYWGSEFPQLAPETQKDGQHVYSRKDVEIVLRIRELLYEGKHTIASARIELAKKG
jgi:DNA-binding transcriptional MerR regulator